MSKKKESHGSKQDFLKRLDSHPELFKGFSEILKLASEPGLDGQIRSADEVESLLIEQTRRLGQETLESWASNFEREIVREHHSDVSGLHQCEKKD